MEYTGRWKEMSIIYQKMGISDKEIAKRIICKTTRIIERVNGLDECDKK